MTHLARRMNRWTSTVVDLLAERAGERLAIEVETGKSAIKTNLAKLWGTGIDRLVLVATSPTAASACRRALTQVQQDTKLQVDLLTWLDVS